MRIGKASPVRILLVGNTANTGALAEELNSADQAVEQRLDDPPAGDGPDEIDQIAGDLRELERDLGDNGPDAVLLASDSSAALAAVLVATKLGTPVARLEVPGEDSPGPNARLIRQLTDAPLAPEPAVIVDWIRGTYTPRA
jgi:hypothetical protein